MAKAPPALPEGLCTALWRETGPAPWGWTRFTRCSVRGIFPAVRAAGKNDLGSFRRGRKPGRGFGPFLDFSGDGGRRTGVPGRLPASAESACYPPGRGAASAARGPLRRRDGRRGDGRGRFAARRGRRTGVPGRLPASTESACYPPGRGAASAARGPLRRRDGRRGDGRGRFAARRGRRTGVPGRVRASVGSACYPPGRGAASAARGPLRRRDEGWGTGADASLRAGDGGPRSAACFCWEGLRSAWPRSGFGGEGLRICNAAHEPGRGGAPSPPAPLSPADGGAGTAPP